MAKNEGILGISVNHGRMALTIMKAGQVSRTLWEEVPENIVDGTKILSRNLFADFLQEKLKQNGIKCKKAAYTIADEELFIKNISMPAMTDEQLRYNIPFEFNDYIHGEMKDYIFDYIKREADENDPKDQIRLLAYAVPLETITGLQETLQMAGLKLEKALPETVACEAVINSVKSDEEERTGKCVLDIGRRGIRMMIFKDGEYSLSHQIDTGEGHAINIIADELSVDTHLAATYLRTNHNDCNRMTPVVNAFKDISLEVLKGLNYYEMSDMTTKLGEVILCGTGALTEPLVEILKERIDKTVSTMDEFLAEYSSDKEVNVTYPSVGLLLAKAPGISGDGSSAQADRKKKVNLKVQIPAIAAALIVIGLVGKFVVYDQFARLNREIQTSNSLFEQIEAKNAIIRQSGELVNEYSHYTWDGMTPEEKGRVKRTDTAKLIDFINAQGVEVDSVTLKETMMTINLRAGSLESVSKLLEKVNEQEIVESSSVVYAATKDKEIEGSTGDTQETIVVKSGVEAQINVYLTNYEEEGNEQ